VSHSLSYLQKGTFAFLDHDPSLTLYLLSTLLARRLSPFGLIQKLLHPSTKKRLREVYGNKIKNGIDPKDENKDGVDPANENKEEPGVSSPSPGQHDSSDETIENLGIASSPPFGQARSPNAQDVDREQQPQLRNRHDAVSLGQRDSSQAGLHPENLTETRSLEERLQRQEDELALLRALVQEFSARLQKHEQRSSDRESLKDLEPSEEDKELLMRDKESLVKEMFLDMEIVDAALEDSEASTSKDTTQTMGWIQRLLKREQASKDD